MFQGCWNLLVASLDEKCELLVQGETLPQSIK